jgi:hypothetical protein
MPPPSSLALDYATDEDVANLAGADFLTVTPDSFKVAAGTDGVFLASDPWTLTSASVDFQAQGVVANMVIQLSQPSGPKTVFRGSGDLLAVETVAGHAITLRRVGQALGWGQPPGPAAGLTGVAFLIKTLKGQLDDVSYKLDQQFAVDPALPNRTPGDAYDLRVLRLCTVYQTLVRQYTNGERSGEGDFAKKIEHYEQAYRDEVDTASLRWGPTGQSQQSGTRFGTRLSR